MVCVDTPTPPTPAISAALVTRPSTAPNTVGRNQPPDTSRCRCDQPAACAASMVAGSADVVSRRERSADQAPSS